MRRDRAGEPGRGRLPFQWAIGLGMALVLAACPAGAVTWDGSTSTSWSDGTNWSTGLEPTTADTVEFPGAIPGTGSTIALSAGEQANSVLFHNSYTLGGGDLTLGGSALATVDSGYTSTITSDLKSTTHHLQDTPSLQLLERLVRYLR